MKGSLWGINMSVSLLFIPLISIFGSALIGKPIIIDFLKFSFVYILVFIPSSLALSSLLLRDKILSFFERVVLGYPVMVIYYSIVYYFSILINLDFVIYFSIIVLYFHLIFGKKTFQNIIFSKKEFFFCWGLIASISILFFIVFSLTTELPEINSDGLYYQDILWTIGNTWSIIIGGFPVTDLRFSDVPFSYHMVQNIFYAFINSLTGIDPFFLHMRFGPLLDIFILGSVVLVGSKVFMQWNLSKSIILFCTLFFTCSFPNWVFNGYVSHIYINPISLFFGLNSFILLFFIFYNYTINNELFMGYTAAVLIFTLGSKSSLIFTLIPSLGVFFIFNSFFKRKIPVREIYFMFIVGVILTVLLLTIYYGAGGNLSLKKYSGDSFYQPVLSLIFRLVKPLVTLHVFSFIALWLLSKGFRMKMKSNLKFIFFITLHFVISITWIVFFNFPGGEVYFLWYSLISFSFLFTFFLDFLFSFNKSFVSKLIPFSSLLIGFLFFAHLSFQSTYRNSIWRYALLNDDVWDNRASISYHEYLAMRWIKSNVSLNEKIISDRRGFSHEVNGQFVNRFFGYSSFSGRQFYNEGDEFSAQYKTLVGERWDIVNIILTSNSQSEVEYLWKKTAANYIVHSKRFTKLGSGVIKSGTKLFENDDITIYKKNK
jgi:hypothetical protein